MKNKGGENMTERERIYDMLSFTLTEYENSLDRKESGWAETLYNVLVEVQRNWETVITTNEI